MGVVLKSVLGLGSVYVAMFAPVAPAPAPNVVGVAKTCVDAARSRLEDGVTLRGELALATCAVALAPAPKAPPPVAVAKPAPVAPPARARGTLTEADLRDAWFGPSEHARKARRPG